MKRGDIKSEYQKHLVECVMKGDIEMIKILLFEYNISPYFYFAINETILSFLQICYRYGDRDIVDIVQNVYDTSTYREGDYMIVNKDTKKLVMS